MNKDEWYIPVYQRMSDPEPIKFPNYRVNVYGQIRSLRRNKILKPVKVKSAGYYEVGLTNEFATKDLYSSQIRCLIHKLVAHTFIPNENFNKYSQVNHIDGNRLHNYVDNLEWVTPSENVKKRFNEKSKSKKEYPKEHYTQIRNQLNMFDNIDE
jgi:hypothetical protein